MADTVEQVYVWDGNAWTPVVRDDCELPISSADGTVTLDSPSANIFTASTGNAGQIRLEPGQASNNYFRVYDTGSPNGALLCPRNSTVSGLTVRPFKETVSGNAYNVYSTLWDYTNNSVNFTNATKDFIVSTYVATAPRCSGDRFFAFNVGGLDPETDFDLVAGLHLNVAFNPNASKAAYNIHCTGTAPNRLESDLQVPKLVGSAAPDSDASIELGANAKIQTEANNSLQLNPAGQAYGILHTARNNSITAHATRPFIQSVNADKNYNVRQTVWEYTTIDLLSDDASTPYRLNDYFSQAFNGKVDVYRGFSVGGYDPSLMQATEAVGCYLNVALPNDGREWYSLWCAGAAPARFDGDIQTTRIAGSVAPDTDASIELGAELLTSNHTPTQPNSIATKQTVDDKIWVGTTAEYNAIATKNPTTLYCLTD